MVRPLVTAFMRHVLRACCVLVITAIVPVQADTLLDFEGLGDLEAVDRFYPGVTFRNAIAEIAGFSLNDAEFPPASGVTVAVPNNGKSSSNSIHRSRVLKVCSRIPPR
jgi:hypothetical protein